MNGESSSSSLIVATVVPPIRDLGDGFKVRRALPSSRCRTVGPFVFFDQMGPVTFQCGQGLDVRPHPHIGLATITYLLEGEILHRDSLGSVQVIRPGEVNWMTAGSGIVHSERTAPEPRATGRPLWGLQTWVALPTAREEEPPGFAHFAASAIPKSDAEGVSVTVMVGHLDGLQSPVETFSPMFYADVSLAGGSRYQLSPEHVERAMYVVRGEVAVAHQSGVFGAGELVVFKPEADILLSSELGAQLMLIGGEPFPERRHIYWNFVSSRADRIEQAKEDWRARRLAGVPGDEEFIPLPDEVASYP